MVEARGMPISMWVAWLSPLTSESRMAAQLAPLAMVALMPYFLKNPFSCAITIGELSVSAMIPKRRFGVSGASLAQVALALISWAVVRATAPVPAPFRNARRDSGLTGFF